MSDHPARREKKQFSQQTMAKKGTKT